MSRLYEDEGWEGAESHIFPCDCSNGDYLRVMWDEDPDFRMLWVELNNRNNSWKQRIKDIWLILRGKERSWGEIILTDKSIKGLLKILNEKDSGFTQKESSAVYPIDYKRPVANINNALPIDEQND